MNSATPRAGLFSINSGRWAKRAAGGANATNGDGGERKEELWYDIEKRLKSPEHQRSLIMKMRSRSGRKLDLGLIVAHACQWGMLVTIFLTMVIYLQYYLVSWSDGSGGVRSFFPARLAAGSNERLNAHLGGRSEVQYKWEWQSEALMELREKERFGEEAYGEISQKFLPVGTASFLFVLVGAYRTGPSSFGVTGLGSRILYKQGKPPFECSWVLPKSRSHISAEGTHTDGQGMRSEVINGTAAAYIDDDIFFADNAEYIAVVVHCTFDSPIGTDGEGGKLMMVAKHDEAYSKSGLPGVEFLAMVEKPGDYSEAVFEVYPYEYLYCGSPLRGSISPQRTREWLAYHMRLFGENSHFILYDAGGIDDALWKVLEPWVKLGRVSIMNAKMESRYKAYLYNQFVLADDCLLRAKSLAKWAFFFDTDEYLHLSEGSHLESSFHDLMAELAQRGRRATSIELRQRPMLPDHCVRNDADPTLHERQWAIEKLVYRRHVNRTYTDWGHWTHWLDVKSFHQAKYVLGRGVHYARHVEVPPELKEWETTTGLNSEDCGNCYENKLHYYHYHGSTSRTPEADVCKVFMDPSVKDFETDDAPHYYDNSMGLLADIVREYEFRMIGNVTI